MSHILAVLLALPLAATSPTVDDLISRLGDASFQKREAASAALIEIGERAMPKLRQASKMSEDPEIQMRCTRLLKAIPKVMAQNQLAKWQGRWENGNEILIINKQYWWWGIKGNLIPAAFQKNTLDMISMEEGVVTVDMHVNIGRHRICKAIFKLEGDTLHYSGSYQSRPTNFEIGGGHVIHWKRMPAK